MIKLALVDADIISYRAGWVVEPRYYELRHKEEGLIQVYKTKAECKHAQEQLDLTDGEVTIEMFTDPEPVEHALQITKAYMESMYDRFPDHTVIPLLSGSSNFRTRIDEFYKANRREQLKPTHIEDIVSYLVNHWGAMLVEGIEADDMIGILSNDESVVVSTDKDLDQIPGHHFNFVTREPYIVSEEEADYFLWLQVLKGDPVDNITGIPGIGPKKAEAILEQSSTQGRKGLVLAAYNSHLEGEEHEVEEEFYKNYQLVKILQSLEELDEVPVSEGERESITAIHSICYS